MSSPILWVEVYELMDYCFQLLCSDLFLSTKLIRLKKKGETLPFIVKTLFILSVPSALCMFTTEQR